MGSEMCIRDSKYPPLPLLPFVPTRKEASRREKASYPRGQLENAIPSASQGRGEGNEDEEDSAERRGGPGGE